MQNIVLLNPKGGCGKSSIATNLSAYYANKNMQVGLADFDPQKTSLNWLRKRTFDLAKIKSINSSTLNLKTPSDLDYLVIDTPASLSQQCISDFINLADSIIIPVLPSPIDIQAAGYFIYQLLMKYKITTEDKNICIVANRARKRSLIYRELTKFTSTIKLPLVTTLSDSRFYIQYADNGSSIFDHLTKQTFSDISDWMPLIDWINKSENRCTSLRQVSSCIAT